MSLSTASPSLFQSKEKPRPNISTEIRLVSMVTCLDTYLGCSRFVPLQVVVTLSRSDPPHVSFFQSREKPRPNIGAEIRLVSMVTCWSQNRLLETCVCLQSCLCPLSGSGHRA